LKQHLNLHQVILEVVNLNEKLTLGLLDDHVVVIVGIFLDLSEFMLFEALELSDEFDTLLFCLELGLSHFFNTVLDNVHLFFMMGLHLSLELDVGLVDGLIEGSPILWELGQHFKIMALWIGSKNFLEHVIGAINFCFDKFGINLLVD